MYPDAKPPASGKYTLDFNDDTDDDLPPSPAMVCKPVKKDADDFLSPTSPVKDGSVREKHPKKKLAAEKEKTADKVAVEKEKTVGKVAVVSATAPPKAKTRSSSVDPLLKNKKQNKNDVKQSGTDMTVAEVVSQFATLLEGFKNKKQTNNEKNKNSKKDTDETDAQNVSTTTEVVSGPAAEPQTFYSRSSESDKLKEDAKDGKTYPKLPFLCPSCSCCSSSDPCSVCGVPRAVPCLAVTQHKGSEVEYTGGLMEYLKTAHIDLPKIKIPTKIALGINVRYDAATIGFLSKLTHIEVSSYGGASVPHPNAKFLRDIIRHVFRDIPGSMEIFGSLPSEGHNTHAECHSTRDIMHTHEGDNVIRCDLLSCTHIKNADCLYMIDSIYYLMGRFNELYKVMRPGQCCVVAAHSFPEDSIIQNYLNEFDVSCNAGMVTMRNNRSQSATLNQSVYYNHRNWAPRDILYKEGSGGLVYVSHTNFGHMHIGVIIKIIEGIGDIKTVDEPFGSTGPIIEVSMPNGDVKIPLVEYPHGYFWEEKKMLIPKELVEGFAAKLIKDGYMDSDAQVLMSKFSHYAAQTFRTLPTSAVNNCMPVCIAMATNVRKRILEDTSTEMYQSKIRLIHARCKAMFYRALSFVTENPHLVIPAVLLVFGCFRRGMVSGDLPDALGLSVPDLSFLKAPAEQIKQFFSLMAKIAPASLIVVFVEELVKRIVPPSAFAAFEWALNIAGTGTLALNYLPTLCMHLITGHLSLAYGVVLHFLWNTLVFAQKTLFQGCLTRIPAIAGASWFLAGAGCTSLVVGLFALWKVQNTFDGFKSQISQIVEVPSLIRSALSSATSHMYTRLVHIISQLRSTFDSSQNQQCSSTEMTSGTFSTDMFPPTWLQSLVPRWLSDRSL